MLYDRIFECGGGSHLGAGLIWVLQIMTCSLSSYSQTVTPFIHYSVAEGFPSSEVYSVFQDKKGFVWFTTDNGVVRFDGKEMDVFQTADGLPDPVVFEIIQDDLDRLWFRSFTGRLSYFDNEGIHLFEHNDSLAKACKEYFMRSLCFDDQGKIWFGNSHGISTIDSTGQVKLIDRHSLNDQVIIRSVQDKFVFSNNGAGLEIIQLNGHRIKAHRNERQNIRKVSGLRWKGEDYFAIGNFIYQVKGDSAKLVFEGSDQIISLATDKSENLWIGYLQSSVEAYSDFGKKLNLNLTFLQSKVVTGLLQDQQGGYWVSTLQDGVYYIPEISFTALDVDVETKITTVHTFEDRTFVGDDQGQILMLDGNGKTKQKTILCKCSVLTILYLPEEDLIWVSTSTNTYILNSSFKVVKEFGQSFSHFLRDQDGEIFGVTSIFLYRFDRHKKVFFFIHDNKKANRSLYWNSKYLFFYGRTGLQVFTPSFQSVVIPRVFDNTKVSVMLPLNDSILFCGTQGNGFLILNQNNWTYQEYSQKTKFNAASVYSGLDDGTRIWLATEKGIAIGDKKDIITGNQFFSFITKKNGLFQDKVNFLTQNKDFVWAYSEKNILTIPKNFTDSNDPIFYQQHFLVNNQRQSMIDGEKLAFDKNNIQFRFRIIDFKNQNIFLRYRLSALANWNYTKDRVLNFYSLSPGEYSFEIESSKDNLHWNKASSFHFAVMPPWWKSWYFQISVALVVLAVGFFYYKRRISLLRERHSYLKIINEQQQSLIRAELETLDRERRRIAKELHDSVGTNLSAIRMMVHRWFRDHNQIVSEDIEGHFQSTIKDLKDIIYKLEPSELIKNGLVATMKNYSELIQRNLEIEIDLKAEGSDPREINVNLTSFRILQELLSNTLKHSKATHVNIEILFSEASLKIRYCDNGDGFAEKSIRRGSGLFNIESRVQAASGLMTFGSENNSGVSYAIDLPIIKT